MRGARGVLCKEAVGLNLATACGQTRDEAEAAVILPQPVAELATSLNRIDFLQKAPDHKALPQAQKGFTIVNLILCL
jgi:hypothetical protein